MNTFYFFVRNPSLDSCDVAGSCDVIGGGVVAVIDNDGISAVVSSF